MSLIRTIVRLAIIEALAPTPAIAADGPWPTVARHRVFDSRHDPIDDLAASERAPIIVVFTDDDRGESGNPAGGPPFRRTIDVSFELSIVQSMETEDATFEPMVPASDAEAEASLDLLEASVRFAILHGPTGACARKFAGRVHSISSLPSRTSEDAIRLASRVMTMRIQVDDDCVSFTPTGTETGLDFLPRQARDLHACLPPGSYGRALIEGLAAFAPTAPVPTRNFTVSAGIDAHVPKDDTADVAFVATPTPAP